MEHISADVPVDTVLSEAVDFAHDAAVDGVGADRVGAHLGVAMEDERLATHLFECTSAGYRGWHWAVTVARTPDDATPTVCDVVLLPGPDALVAPEWVPWSERVQPGDLGVGDVLPTSSQDPRLIAGFTDEDALETVASQSPLSPGQWEMGLGRVRVLSPIGRDDAADRWYAGDMGPDSAMAKGAALNCVSCGFMVPMGGAFGPMFGVCANVMAPADGHVVALDYGCGAHSEVQVDEVVLDEVEMSDEASSDETTVVGNDLVEDALEDIIDTVTDEEAAGMLLDLTDVEGADGSDDAADDGDETQDDSDELSDDAHDSDDEDDRDDEDEPIQR